MAERLQQNIFTGVLPQAYNLIDNGDDASKWFQSWNPVTEAKDTAWDTITPGDDAGYLEKGLRFSSAALAANATAGAARSSIIYGMNSMYFGFTFRPDANIFTQTSNSVTYRIKLFCYDAGAASGENLLIDFHCTKMDAGKTSWVYWDLNTEAGAPYNFFTRRFMHVDWDPIPWWRLMFYIKDRVVISGKINNQPFSCNYTMGGFPMVVVAPAMVQACCFNNSGGAIACGYDIDQIWLSDTENIV